ncbi:P-loop containing nucleoside triphosphate hydrolase protein [Mycena alexandri]|uniref:P-loop containing nucleoside triphosphate hydrolase protein n=1 Tax=Mycena alexandri TaxID=1745969 RepID=A0AAD6S7S2_9AGAR|nr:P-loop containing nucleoside triphosphate hydrolase protein [Mycena alexandri]
MAKRRATAESDDDNASRARTADSDDERAPPASKRRASNKGKARPRDDDDESESDNGAEDGEEADRKFEEEHEDSIRAVLESRRKVHGGIAEHGIIENIEMHQFMCHKYLTFSFGPSDQLLSSSAVLSAITVALGGKANSTGRGNGLKSFIREGQSEEAYKPKDYGKSIVITRRFTKEGNSSWKIRSKAGRVISTKKDELAAICDHMNIQVDNPMNVLTQDAARQFLSASAPTDKYKFFLRGTQLSQLSEEYDTCFANITATTKVLSQKKEAIPDLKTAFREASARFEEASKAREQKKKVDELKKELAWSHVAAKKQEMEKKTSEAAKMTQRLPKIQDRIDEAEANLAAAEKTVVELEQELDALGNRTDLQDKKTGISNEIKAQKASVSVLNNNIKEINNSLKTTNKQIEDYKVAIETETKRLQKDTESEREESQRKVSAARAEVALAADALKDIRDKQAANDEELQLRQKVNDCESAINDCLRADENKYAAFVQRINQTQWHGQKPLGPFGAHVKIRDSCIQYTELLRNQLSSLLSSFAITDARDHQVLKKILADSGNSRTAIHLYKPDLFDYRQGEPPEGVLTVLRALDISDPHVLRLMINKASIESRILAPKRIDAERILANMRFGTGRRKAADYKHLQAKMLVRDLQNAINEELPAQLTAIQDALKASFSNNICPLFKVVLVAQFTELSRQKAELDEKQKELVAQRDKIQNELRDFANIQEDAKAKIDQAVEQRTIHQGAITHFKKKLDDENEKVKAAEAVAERAQEEFTEYCERVPANRHPDVVKRALDSTQAALKEREKRHGASVEEMTIETDLKQMTSLNKALKASLIVRLSRWQEFRRHIALRCKLVFGYHLSQRGYYYGKVLFDHEKGTLQLKVQTDDQAATQGARDKDPRSLSGGEKSFSTICLLLSLWESIGCPLRCLDEFDVFMDAVNRRISMKMMIDTANQSDKKQYVLITPQDMNNVSIGPTVRRGQGVLGFAS